MKRAALLLSALGLGAAALVAVLVVGGGERGGAPAEAAPVAPPGAAPAAQARSAGELDAVDVPREGATPESAELAPEPTGAGDERRAVASRETANAGPVELVFVARAGPAVGDVPVWLRWSGEGESVPWDLQEVDAFRRAARALRADGAGVLRVPREAGRVLFVVAETPGDARLFGRRRLAPAEIAPGKEPARVELVRDWDLVVQTLDADGAPLPDVPLRLIGARGGAERTSSHRTAGEQALVRMRHVGFDLAGRGEPRELRWSVEVEGLFVPPVVAELDPANPPAEIVVLRLPAFGSVEVEVVEAGGGPVADGTGVELGVVREGEGRELSAFDGTRRRYVGAPTSGGSVLFAPVGLGHGELEARTAPRRNHVFSRVYGPGPALPGERARLRLEIGLDHPVLLLRAVDFGREPLRDTALDLRLFEHSRHLSNTNTFEVRTDGEGRFRVDLAPGYADGDVRTLDVRAAGEAGAAEQRVAQLDLARDLPPGLRDLGDVVLAPPPLLVAGRVVDTEGRGVAGARVEVREHVQREDAGIDEWNEVGGEAVASGPDGAFEVHGRSSAVELRLRAQHAGAQCAPVRASVGARGVVLSLLETGTVRGTLLVDDGFPPDDLYVRLEPQAAEHWNAPFPLGRSSVADAQGRFQVADVLPGVYRLELRPRRGGDEVLMRDDVRVLAGEETVLEPIDLRGRLFVHELVLLPPRATSSLVGLAEITPSETRGEHSWLHFRASPVRILTAHRLIDVELSVQDHLVEKVERVEGRREVRLREGLPVRLLLRTDGEVPGPPIRVKVVLIPADGDTSTVDWGAPAFDERREVLVRAPGAGTMRVQWVVERQGSGGSAVASTVDIEPAQTLEIQDVPTEQVFEIEISAAELRRIAGEL